MASGMTKATKATVEQILDAVIERGPKLRRAGIQQVQFESCVIVLSPLDPNASVIDEKTERKPSGWKDPALYGLDDDAEVPGRSKRVRPEGRG